MKTLILGANGQVGYELAKCNQQAIALTRDQVNFSIPGQITELINQHKPDMVINAVAYTAVDKAETEPSLAMLINAVAVQELARACRKHNAWLIHYSTDYVFDGNSEQPYRETDVVKPLGIYGQTKWAGEEFIKHELDKHIILRTSWVYSQRGANFVNTMLRLSDERDELSIVNDQLGCPTYAADIAKATQKVVQQLPDDASLSGIYHLTGSEATSWFEFAQTIFEYSGKEIKVNPIPTSEFPTLAIRPRYSILDNTKLNNTFGISLPGYTQALKHCLGQSALVQ